MGKHRENGKKSGCLHADWKLQSTGTELVKKFIEFYEIHRCVYCPATERRVVERVRTSG